MLEVKNLTFSYDKKRNVLEDVSFTARSGEVMSIIGPNGTGKTTLLNCLVGSLPPSAGEVFYNGKNLNQMPFKERARYLGYVPQTIKCDLNIKVMDYILLGRSPYLKFRYGREDYQIAEEIMDEVGIREFAMRDIRRLSGGERQKISIARALVQKPQILLLDEPTSALDIRNQIDVLRLLRRIAAEKHLLVLMTIHDLSLSLMFSDEVAMLKESRLVRKGKASEVIREDSIREVYQVEASVVEERYIHLHG